MNLHARMAEASKSLKNVDNELNLADKNREK